MQKVANDVKKPTVVKQPVKINDLGKIIAVSSCKGGVGKSTIAYSIANNLARNGKKVGFLDLDIYGPSVPSLIGFFDKFELNDQKKLIPIEKNGVHYASVGFVSDNSNALVWRGAMISKIINSLVLNCAWSKMDYTILDMPPGTGDAYLSFFQNYQTCGVFLVSTDSSLACSDLKRSIAAFDMLRVPILGCIQNMSDVYQDGQLQKICDEKSIAITDKILFYTKDNSNQTQDDFIMKNITPLNAIQMIESYQP
jgi:ATP-binding protein involved in chromosome partitioning